MNKSVKYPVVEIFKSLQGEGFNTGREVVFLRLGGCNLACPWCDTNYNDYTMIPMESIVEMVDAFEVKSLLVTGGEPLIVEELKALIQLFKNLGFWIGVETNGVSVAENSILKLFDYITVSPKACYADLYRGGPAVTAADEVRVVAEDNALEFCRFISGVIAAEHYYLSPCERDGKMDIEQCVRALGCLNQSDDDDTDWLLSLQTHKLCGLP